MKLFLGWILIIALLSSGCAGLSRGCASCNAETFGSDWIVVQYNAYGEPMNAWKLEDVSISNEDKSDGIYWKDTNTGHLVHISGWYNRIQVNGRKFDEAASLVGIKIDHITNGKYQK